MTHMRCHCNKQKCTKENIDAIRQISIYVTFNMNIQCINTSLRCCHNEYDGVSNHQTHHCLLSRLFRRRSKKTPKLRVTGLCVGNSPVNSPHKGLVTRKTCPFDDVIMWWCRWLIWRPVKKTLFCNRQILQVKTTRNKRHHRPLPDYVGLDRLSWEAKHVYRPRPDAFTYCLFRVWTSGILEMVQFPLGLHPKMAIILSLNGIFVVNSFNKNTHGRWNETPSHSRDVIAMFRENTFYQTCFHHFVWTMNNIRFEPSIYLYP